jgi:alpha-galactosidase
VNIDAGWIKERLPNGSITVDRQLFPEGIAPVAAYIESKGMAMGIYTSRGKHTCGGWDRPGSEGYEFIDAKQYAEWGISYVKVDSCGGNRSMTNQGVWDQHVTWRAALNATGRRMWLSICPAYVYEDAFPDEHCIPGFAYNSRGWTAMGLDPR